MLDQLLTELLAGDNPLSWGTFLIVSVYVGKVALKLYQDHTDWKRKTTQEKEEYERKVESGQEEWQRQLIKEMFNQSSSQHQGTMQILNKQTDVLSALQIAITRLEGTIIQGQSRRRTDFSKGATTHEQQKAVIQTETLTKVEG